MKNNPTVKKNPMLWWVSAISLSVSAAVFITLKDLAKTDAAIESTRLMVAMMGIIIAGICIISATANHWFNR